MLKESLIAILRLNAKRVSYCLELIANRKSLIAVLRLIAILRLIALLSLNAQRVSYC